jgi:Ca2+/Na+ antiporter
MTDVLSIRNRSHRLRDFVLADRSARRFRLFALVCILTALAVLLFSTPDVRAVLAPAIVIVAGAFLYLTVQIRREGHMPIFEAATFFMLATAVYSTVPLLQFLLGGMKFGPWSDNRLWVWDPSPQEFGTFAWRHAVLMTAFVLAYLPMRGKKLWPLQLPVCPTRTMTAVIVLLLLALTGWFYALEFYIGKSGNVYQGATVVASESLPQVVQQLSNIFGVVRVTLKQCLIVILLMNWQRPRYRYLLLAWLGIEIGITLITFVGRTPLMLLLLTFAVAFHLLVRPLKPAFAVFAGCVLLVAVLVYGFFRDIRFTGVKDERSTVINSATEFQILYGTAYDLYRRQMEGSLGPVPYQIYFVDFYRLIPSQLLPFYKWEAADWYMEVMGQRGTGVGFMFGIVAQSVVGFGYYELAVRGILLAAFYAFAHRFYRRHSRSFWATISYLFILTWAYYAFRSTSFEILYRLAYYLVPTWLLVRFLTAAVTEVRKSVPRVRA